MSISFLQQLKKIQREVSETTLPHFLLAKDILGTCEGAFQEWKSGWTHERIHVSSGTHFYHPCYLRHVVTSLSSLLMQFVRM
jgi:hypothetical protein